MSGGAIESAKAAEEAHRQLSKTASRKGAFMAADLDDASIAERIKLTCSGQQEKVPWKSDYAAARCQVE